MALLGRLATNGSSRFQRVAGVLRRGLCAEAELPSIELYQYEVCPFCAKAKATMDYYKVPYSTVEVNPLNKKELRVVTKHKKVPVAFIGGMEVVESDVIMDEVRALKTSERLTEEELKWRDWSNRKLVVSLPPNLYRSLSDSWASFKYISLNNKFGTLESLYVRVVGSVFMNSMKGRMMKKHGIENERDHLATLLRTWIDEAVSYKNFQLGDEKPGVADLAVFGMLRSMKGIPTFEFAMEQPGVKSWYEAVEECVGPTSRTAIL